jgi:hypothetical protein
VHIYDNVAFNLMEYQSCSRVAFESQEKFQFSIHHFLQQL